MTFVVFAWAKGKTVYIAISKDPHIMMGVFAIYMFEWS